MHYIIDSGIVLFCNHGCIGTYNVGQPGKKCYTEMSVHLHHAEGELIESAPIFSPITERHIRQFLTQDFFLRDVKKGEEILCNYLEFIGDSNNWEEDVMG
jgi:hypothetical protein